MNQIKRSTGFTLIELIIIIVILGILAVTAAPKFLDIRNNAIIATLKGAEAAIKGGVNLSRAQAIIDGQLSGEGRVILDGGLSIETLNGHPQANWLTSIRYLLNSDSQYYTQELTPCPHEWCGLGEQTGTLPTDNNATVAEGGSGLKLYPRGYTYLQHCGVHYINNRDGQRPIIGISTSGC